MRAANQNEMRQELIFGVETFQLINLDLRSSSLRAIPYKYSAQHFSAPALREAQEK